MTNVASELLQLAERVEALVPLIEHKGIKSNVLTVAGRMREAANRLATREGRSFYAEAPGTGDDGQAAGSGRARGGGIPATSTGPAGDDGSASVAR